MDGKIIGKTSSKTITRKVIVDSIALKTSLSLQESEKLLAYTLEEISQALIRGESVKCSNFGTFNINNKPQRLGRHPIDGKSIYIPPSNSAYFKASANINQKVNNTNSDEWNMCGYRDLFF